MVSEKCYTHALSAALIIYRKLQVNGTQSQVASYHIWGFKLLLLYLLVSQVHGNSVSLLNIDKFCLTFRYSMATPRPEGLIKKVSLLR